MSWLFYGLSRGNLDTEALGGAGFASQRTVDIEQHWDLSSVLGLEIIIDSLQSDDNISTLILKAEILRRNPVSGREQATISWEYDFSTSKCRPSLDEVLLVPWVALRSLGPL